MTSDASPVEAPLRVFVSGAGAVGSFLGGLLASRGHEVALARRSHPAIPSPGSLVIERWDGRRIAASARLVRTARDPAPDVVILAMRQFAMADAVADLGAWPAVPVVTVQNGVGAEDLVASLRPAAPLVAASLTSPIEQPAADRVAWLGRGGLGLAVVQGPVEPLLERLAAEFAAAGLPTAHIAEAAAMKWSKLVANLVANATGALLDLDPGAVYADPRLFAVERRQLLEALAVMRALGLGPVALPGAAVPLLALGARAPAILARPVMARIVGGARGGKLPSLRLHLRAGGGPSEVAWLNGAVATAGARLGVPTPVNRTLAALVEAASADAARRDWFRGHPDRLLAALAESAPPA